MAPDDRGYLQVTAEDAGGSSGVGLWMDTGVLQNGKNLGQHYGFLRFTGAVSINLPISIETSDDLGYGGELKKQERDVKLGHNTEAEESQELVVG